VNLEEIAHELYGLPPERFTEARNTRVAEIATIGDRELAAEVRKLSKPTVAAWLANMLVRQHSREVEELIALGAQVREAHRRGARHDMRQVADRRRRLIGKLVEAASKSATEAGHSVGLQVQRLLEETLEAAVMDTESAASLRQGRLSAPLHFIGFGGVPSTESGTRLNPTRQQGVMTKKPSSQSEVGGEKRRAAERALADAESSVSNAQKMVEWASASMNEAYQRHDAASARHRAAVKDLRDAERDRARTGEALHGAREAHADAERRLKVAERERRQRRADLESSSNQPPKS
jgi:hypothetical protein